MYFELADYRLTDLLSTAGATIGIIIAAGILLGNLGEKFTAACQRYRDLSGEYRANHLSSARRDNLQTELSCYRRQVAYLSYATRLICCGLLSFMVTVLDAGLSIMFPKLMILRTIGTTGLIVGLLCLAGAIVLQLVETVLQQQALRKEMADFEDHLPSASAAVRR